MTERADRSPALAPIRRISQIRQYAPDRVPDEVVDQLTRARTGRRAGGRR